MMPKRQIIAMGGGGFLSEQSNGLLDEYVLKVSGKEEPRICFIPTACGDAPHRIEQFYHYFGKYNCIPNHLSLFRGHTEHIKSFLEEQDIFYVGGGNTRNMLVLWKEWGIDKLLQSAYHKGKLLCGVSAGSICWFEEGVTDSIPNQLVRLPGLGMLPGSNCPHFDSEEGRKPMYLEAMSSGNMLLGIATDDHCALHYVNEKVYKVIAAEPGAKAYAFSKDNDCLQELVLQPEYLGLSTKLLLK